MRRKYEGTKDADVRGESSLKLTIPALLNHVSGHGTGRSATCVE